MPTTPPRRSRVHAAAPPWKEQYIYAYNAVQLSVWSIGLVLAIATAIMIQVHEACKVWIQLAQSIMIMDLIHIIAGLVPGSVLTCCLQIGSRLYVVFAVLYPQFDPSVCELVTYCAWSLAEVIRYGYYLQRRRWLTWLRYTAFLVLYPVGVFGGEMPVTWNHANLPTTSWWMRYCDLGVMCLSVPGLAYLMFYMWRQRRKHVGGASEDRAERIRKT